MLSCNTVDASKSMVANAMVAKTRKVGLFVVTGTTVDRDLIEESALRNFPYTLLGCLGIEVASQQVLILIHLGLV